MRIAYYFEWSAGPESGVFKKIIAQTKFWAINGHQVAIFVLSAVDNQAIWQQSVYPGIEVYHYHWKTRSQRFIKMQTAIQRVVEFQPDIVYKRFGPYYFVFEKLFRSTKLVLEVNTDDLGEYALRALHRYVYHRLTRRRLLSQIDGLVFVSREVSQKPHYTRFAKPFRVIANGIDLQHYIPFSPPTNIHPFLVFIGSPRQAWHGIDKLLFLARKNTEWSFALIGPSPADFDRPLPDNVTTHGMMQRDKYETILAQADVGIGSLALHRVNIHENSPLKLPEYLAYGIPAIVGYQETNFLDRATSDFLLELPSSEDNVASNLESIRRFVQNMQGKRVPRTAIQHIDAQVKEKERLAFFQKIIDSG
jgi:hypothetical protein